MADSAVSSQQVNWWTVHEHVAPLLTQVGAWPMVGTPEWCDLPDDDPAKLAALYDAAQHWALRIETCQAARCEASQAISAAANWAAIGRRLRAHTEFYESHPWAERSSA